MCAARPTEAQPPAQSDPCKQASSSKALDGEHGNQNDAYFFRHVSDIHPANGLFKYGYLLINLHDTNVLPAEWTRVGIYFGQIGVGGCGYNSRKSSKSFVEKETVIKYGPTCQFTKDASAYLPKGAAAQAEQPNAQKERPVLESRIYVRGPKETLDMTFRCDVTQGTQYRYTLVNEGSVTFHYVIPDLAKPLQTYGSDSQWVAVGEAIYRSEPKSKLSIQLEAPGHSVEERLLDIYLTTSELKYIRDPKAQLKPGNPIFIAKGRVSVYLPSAAK